MVQKVWESAVKSGWDKRAEGTMPAFTVASRWTAMHLIESMNFATFRERRSGV